MLLYSKDIHVRVQRNNEKIQSKKNRKQKNKLISVQSLNTQ